MAQLVFGTGSSVGFGTTASATSGTASFNKTDLSNVAVGDLLVAWIHSQTTTVATITPPSGWTRHGANIGNPSMAVTRLSGIYYYPCPDQVAIDALPATITWTFSSSAGRVGCVVARATGVDLTNIEDAEATTFDAAANASSLVLSSITTINATTLLVGGLHHQNSASTSSPATTSFMTAFQEYKTAPSGSTLSNSAGVLGFTNLTSAGATGTVTATFDSNVTNGGGELVAFRALNTPPPVTRPTIVGSPTTAVGVSDTSTTFTINKPSGVENGDLLIMSVSAQTQTATSDFTSAGWSRISQGFVPSSSADRITGFFALPVPVAANLVATDFTFTCTDATGGRIAATMFIVRGADLTDPTSGGSPYGSPSIPSITVSPDKPTANSSLLLLTYNGQFTTGNSFALASVPSGMTEVASHFKTSTNGTTTPVVVYAQDVEAVAITPKTLTWAGTASQLSAVAVSIRKLAEPDVSAGIPIKFTSAPDTLADAHVFYTSAPDTLASPLEVRPFPTGYSSVTAMLTEPMFYVAHRGGSRYWPEGSLHAYTQSGFWGAGALEIPLARTSDGVWFGLHDSTLDRTSGVSGVTASSITWAQVQTYQILGSMAASDPGQANQPYMRWEELMDAYYSTHVIFIDPKYASAHVTELLNMMDAMPGTPTERFVAKYYGVSSFWSTPARARGYKAWGYFYQSDASNFATYQGNWDILGMDYGADQATWDAISSYGKKVIGHIVPDNTAAMTAIAKGADGLMVSGVKAVIPRNP